ncbi:hypothetical protein ACIRPX_32525 [Streptomyces sp. NPDC101225]|uniref:hypothetical protein n=1 Tax=Streptomyces sp. NPDC101225 TaxID=3366135 RepID=UPI00380EF3B6
MRARAAAAAALLAVGLLAGCAREHAPAATAPSSSASPSGYPEMEQKVAAAESALAQADKDAAQDDSDGTDGTGR